MEHPSYAGGRLNTLSLTAALLLVLCAAEPGIGLAEVPGHLMIARDVRVDAVQLLCLEHERYRGLARAQFPRAEVRGGFRDLQDLGVALERGTCDALVGDANQLSTIRERAVDPRALVIRPLLF